MIFTDEQRTDMEERQTDAINSLKQFFEYLIDDRLQMAYGSLNRLDEIIDDTKHWYIKELVKCNEAPRILPEIFQNDA